MLSSRLRSWIGLVGIALLVYVQPAQAQNCTTNADCDAGQRCVEWFDPCTPTVIEADCAEYPIDDGLDNDGDGFFDFAFGKELDSPRTLYATVIKRGRIKITGPSTGQLRVRVFGFGDPSTPNSFHCIVGDADLTAVDVDFRLTPLAATQVVPNVVDATLPAGALELRGPDRYVFKDRSGASGIRKVKVKRKGGVWWVIDLLVDDVDLTGMEHPDFTSLGAFVMTFGSLGNTQTVQSWVMRGPKWRTLP